MTIDMAQRIEKFLSPITTATTKVNNTINGALYNTPTMGTDSYNTSIASVPPQVQAVPLYQFFDDPNKPPNPLNYKLASRLSWFGINDSQEYLKAANTPFKRSLIRLLGGIFLNKQDSEYLKYHISAWACQADLMRTGADLQTARLMQISGAGDVSTLSRYASIIDKGALYAAMGANALQYGYHMPTFKAVSQYIDTARTLQPVIRW